MTKLAFLFPGQASQYPGMGCNLFETFPESRAVFEEADNALGFSISKLCFEGSEDALKLTENTQPAILTVSVAAYRALEKRGITPDLVAGHSLGEYSALVAAGALAFADAVQLARRRGQYMQEAVPAGDGAMAAILGLDPDLIRVICEQVEDKLTPLPGDPAALNFVPGSAVVAAANLNSPGQTVISGAKAAVERAAELCKQAGAKRAVMLPVSAPFHCTLMQPAQESLARDLAELEFRDPAFPVAANVSARLITTGVAAREALVAQVTGAVRWVECIELLAAEGATQFVEVGPGRVLSGLLKQIQGKDAAAALNVEDSASLEKTLAALKG